MLPISRPTFISLYLSVAFTIALNLSVLPVEAINPKDTLSTPVPTQKQILIQTKSEKTLNFENIYRIELALKIPGDIEIIATEGDSITVTLEKQTQATNTERGHTYACIP